jgi:hypothetical protein
MNQKQRDFLIYQVENTCKEKKEKLEKQIPEKPSLNNYLIASFLDNTIQFNNIDTLKKKIRQRVIDMGKGDSLIESDKWDDDEDEVVKINPEDLFIIPEAYQIALDKYENKKDRIEAEIEKVQHISQTVIMKIQIGSAESLQKLIMQVDDMGDLNLVNTQLALEEKPKK